MSTLHVRQHGPSFSRHGDPLYHQNSKIYLHVYTGLPDADIVPAIESTVAAMVANSEHDLLIIIDLREVRLDMKALSAFRRTSTLSKHLIKKISVIGIHEIQTAFLNYISSVFGLNIRAFDDIEKAKEWLVG